MKFNRMKSLKLSLPLIVLMTASLGGRADELEIGLSTQSMRGEYFLDISSRTGIGGNYVPIGLFFNEDDEYAASVGFTASGVPAGENPLTFGIGTKFYYVSIDEGDDDSAYSLALGGRVQYSFPTNSDDSDDSDDLDRPFRPFRPTHIVSEIYYAPSIATGGDADNLLDFKARAEIELVPQTTAFVGYSLLSLDLESGDDTNLDNNVQVGIRVSF